MRIGIDLLWVRPGICGGTESYIRNLLDGFVQYDKENTYVLFAALDNADTFSKYSDKNEMELVTCNINCAHQAKRILWENIHLDRMAKKEKIDVMFIPVYSKPMTWGSGIPYVSVIHDLQALHYPQYFSTIRRTFLQYMWWYACKSSKEVVTISDYCKEDLIAHYPGVKNKISTIYDPVISRDSQMDFTLLEQKYAIQKENFFYCVSSMLPHKNLDTLLRLMAAYKQQGNLQKLVISGVGGQNKEFEDRLSELDIHECVVQTGFISNEERDCLYENCKMFLFPSIFEGFGMPPIEAMRKGKTVVMTRKSCLQEVTQGKAVYVDEPTDITEWQKKIILAEEKMSAVEPFHIYDLENIVQEYRKLFQRISQS